MARGMSGGVARELARIYGEGPVTSMTDGQLLDRFLARRDDVAFEALVIRHGPMVLGVCRGILRNPADADDAFQAAFLVLVRRAGSIRGREAIGGWLHRVTCRIALKARQAERTRPGDAGEIEAIDTRIAAPEALAHLRELRSALHEELDRLPERYRTPILLCDLQGLTHDEAARRLRWPIGTVKGRLSRARERLKARLVRRGITAPASLVGGTLLAGSGRAAVPDALRHATLKAGMAAAAGPIGLATGAVSITSLTLAQGALRTMWIARMQFAALGATLLIAGTGTGWLASSGQESPPAGDRPETAAPAVAAESDLDALQGVWYLVSSASNSGQIRRFDPRERPILVVQGDGFYFGSPGETPESVVDDDPETFTLDVSSKPRRIRLQPNRQAREIGTAGLAGVYRIEGNELTLALGSASNPPNSFEPAEPAYFVDVYQRANLTHTPVGSEPRDPSVGSELDRLQGRWRLASVEQSGRRLPPSGSQEDTVWDIKEDQLFVEVGGQRISEHPTLLKLGVDELPHTIELIAPEQRPGSVPMTGIFRIVRDTLEICSPWGDSNERPTDFRTTSGSKLVLQVFRRESDAPRSPFDPDADPGPGEDQTVPSEVAGPEEQPANSIDRQAALDRRRADLDLLEIEVEADKRAIEELMDLLRKGELPEAPSPVDFVTEEKPEAKRDQGRMLRDRRDSYRSDLIRLLKDRKNRYFEQSRLLAEETRLLAEADRSASAMALAKGGEIELSPPRKARPGDGIIIEVLEALPGRPITGERVVRTDGTIGLDFYGDLFVAGLTRDEIKVKLVEHLRKFLTDDALGLVEAYSETSEEIAIPPADSNRVFVDNRNEAPASQNIDEAIQKTLDRVLQRLDSLEQKMR